jgi:hypothetical protein
MKKVFLFICITLGLIQFQSCKPKDGEPGPAGESSMFKLGSFSGTLHYKLANGDTAIVPYNFEYYDSEKNNAFLMDTLNDSYYFNIYRKPAKDVENYFYMYLYNGGLDINNNPLAPTPTELSFNFALNSKINNKFFYLRAYDYDAANSSFSNYSFNPTTGNLSYNYEIVISPNNFSSNGINDGITNAKLIGKFSSTLASDEFIESGFGNSYK